MKKILIILSVFIITNISYGKWTEMKWFNKGLERSHYRFMPTKNNLYVYYREGNNGYVGRYINGEIKDVKQYNNLLLLYGKAFIFRERNYFIYIKFRGPCYIKNSDIYVIEYFENQDGIMFGEEIQLTDYVKYCQPCGYGECGGNYLNIYVEENKYVHLVYIIRKYTSDSAVIYQKWDGTKISKSTEILGMGDMIYRPLDNTIPKIIIDKNGDKHIIWYSGDGLSSHAKTTYKYSKGEKWYGPMFIINSYSSNYDGITKDENDNIIAVSVYSSGGLTNKINLIIKKKSDEQWSNVNTITAAELGVYRFAAYVTKLYLIAEGNNILSIFVDEMQPNEPNNCGRLMRVRVNYNDVISGEGGLKIIETEFSNSDFPWFEIQPLDYYYNEKLNILYNLAFYGSYYGVSCENYIENVSNEYESNWLKIIFGIIIMIVIIKYLKYGVKVVYNLIINLSYQ